MAGRLSRENYAVFKEKLSSLPQQPGGRVEPAVADEDTLQRIERAYNQTRGTGPDYFVFAGLMKAFCQTNR